MPEKRDSYSSYGQKIISLFAKLLFSRQRHSLIELSRMLHCSKQTVLRLVDDIKMAYGASPLTGIDPHLLMRIDPP